MSENNLMLSVSGLRGIVGEALTPGVAFRYGAAVGSWFRKNVEGTWPHIIVGRDSRPSGPTIEQAVVKGLMETGCRVTCIGIASTPGTAIMIDHLDAEGGVVVTASHNPEQWNGIKTLGPDGVAPPPEHARDIIERFHAGPSPYTQNPCDLGQDDAVVEVHTERILRHIDLPAIRSGRPKVVLDSVHGAGGPETAHLLNQLGVDLIHLYADPNGDFPHAPEPTAEHLTGLSRAVAEHGADVGFAQDPDADRLAIVDETGRYIGEEYTLALCAQHVLQTRMQVGAVVVANLSTSRMLDDIVARADGECRRTPVGEAHVAAEMRRCGAVFGGEGNGGVIFPPVCYVRDSLAGIGLVLEMLAKTKRTVSDLVSEIPAYVIVKDKLPIVDTMAERAIDRLGQKFAQVRVDRQDGIRIDFEGERSWVHLRPSNTEPILRIIAEAPQKAAAEELIARCRACLD